MHDFLKEFVKPLCFWYVQYGKTALEWFIVFPLWQKGSEQDQYMYVCMCIFSKWLPYNDISSLWWQIFHMMQLYLDSVYFTPPIPQTPNKVPAKVTLDCSSPSTYIKFCSSKEKCRQNDFINGIKDNYTATCKVSWLWDMCQYLCVYSIDIFDRLLIRKNLIIN